MKLAIRYERKDFEDTIENASKELMHKAFKAFKNDIFISLYIDDNKCIYWDTFKNFEDKVVTVRTYDNTIDYNIDTMPFDKVKREIYKSID